MAKTLMTLTKCPEVEVNAGPLNGATVGFKHGSFHKRVVFPRNKSATAFTKLCLAVVAMDKLTSFSTRNVTIPVFSASYTSDPDPNLHFGLSGRVSIKDTVNSDILKERFYIPGFVLDSAIHTSQMIFDQAMYDLINSAYSGYMANPVSLMSVTPNLTQLYLKGAIDRIKGVLTISDVLSSWMENLDITYDSYVRFIKPGQRAKFFHIPQSVAGSGAVDTVDPLTDNKPTNCLSGIWNTLKKLDELTSWRIAGVSMKAAFNSAFDNVPADQPGREESQTILFRVTSVTTGASETFELNIPGFAPQDLDSDETDAQLVIISDYYKSVFSTNNTDLVEILR